MNAKKKGSFPFALWTGETPLFYERSLWILVSFCLVLFDTAASMCSRSSFVMGNTVFLLSSLVERVIGITHEQAIRTVHHPQSTDNKLFIDDNLGKCLDAAKRQLFERENLDIGDFQAREIVVLGVCLVFGLGLCFGFFHDGLLLF